MFTYNIYFSSIEKKYYLRLIPSQKLYNLFSNEKYMGKVGKINIDHQLKEYLDIIFHKDNNKLIMSIYIHDKMRTYLKKKIISYIKINNFGMLIKNTDIDYYNMYKFNITNPEILLQLI